MFRNVLMPLRAGFLFAFALLCLGNFLHSPQSRIPVNIVWIAGASRYIKEAMNPFPWHPVDLGLKLALAPYAWFDPVLEWYTPPSDFSHGTYFGLARWGDADKRCGYVATQDFRGGFRECEFALEELEALEGTLKAISIPPGSSVGAFDEGSGLIRIYHGHEGLIDFFYRDIEQPQWDPLFIFIHETTERFLPSPQSHIQRNVHPPKDSQPRAHGRKTLTIARSSLPFAGRNTTPSLDENIS